MLPGWFMSLLLWDRILIVAYSLFSIVLIAALVIVSEAERRRKLQRRLIFWIDRLQEFTSAMRDDEPFDPKWMDAEKWRRTRP